MRFCRMSATVWLILAAAPTASWAFQPLQQSQQCSLSTTASTSAVSPSSSSPPSTSTSTTELAMSSSLDRRNFGAASLGLLVSAATTAALPSVLLLQPPQPANAQVFFDPAQYGDQELRVGAVDSLRESVRRAILKKPDLAPSFFQLALLDALSYNAKTNEYGPDGSIIKVVLSSKNTDAYTTNLKECCLALLEAEKTLKRKTAITLADAIAVGGGEAIESIGGPVLPVQLGRADTPPQASSISPDLPLDLFAGTHSTADITNAFLRAGLTEREMTVLLCGLLTLEIVEKSRDANDWKQSGKPKFREAGKMGRMSEFRRLTDEDIADAEAQAALEADPEYQDPDDGWYIADSFGTRDDRFGQRLGKEDINEKTFNKYIKEVTDLSRKNTKTGNIQAVQEKYGWVAALLVDPSLPTTQTWLLKYAGSNLSFIKDLGIAFNSLTQLGAVYTGGKYESLLKNRPRKSLNDDDLNLF